MNQPLTTEQLHNKIRATGFEYNEELWKESRGVVFGWSDDEWFETFIDAISAKPIHILLEEHRKELLQVAIKEKENKFVDLFTAPILNSEMFMVEMTFKMIYQQKGEGYEELKKLVVENRENPREIINHMLSIVRMIREDNEMLEGMLNFENMINWDEQ
jgi:hypothetical protein